MVGAFEGEKNGRRLKELLESSGTAACLLCRSADQVKRLVRQQRLTAVVCGYKFPDGTAEELAGELPGFCTVLLLAPRGLLELVPERPGLLRLPAPAGRRELLAAVEELLRLGEEAGALLPPRRSREEREVVERAKERLMARNGMTEEEAIDKLQSEGFGADVKAREYSDKQGEGRVMKQDPLNDKVKPGATVQITISKGPEPEPEPDPKPEQPTNPGTTDPGTNNPGGTTDPGTTDPGTTDPGNQGGDTGTTTPSTN